MIVRLALRGSFKLIEALMSRVTLEPKDLASPARRWTAAPFAGLRREICFWVVPPHDGKPRRFRCSLRRLLAFSFVTAAALGTLVFVAGDYARLQLMRAEIYFSMHRLANEREDLASNNDTLRNQLHTMQEAQLKASTFERGIQSRLEELAAILDSSRDLGLLGASKLANKRPTVSKKASTHNELAGRSYTTSGDHESLDGGGLGGAELDCSGPDGRARCAESLIDDVALDQARASFAWPSDLHLAQLDRLNRGRMLEVGLTARLDRYVDLLKTLPLSLPGNGHVRSGYGTRVSPFSGELKMHEGIDFALPAGSRIFSSGDGVVLSVEHNATYGLVVDIQHTDRIVSRYAHLSRALVSEGERVCRGEVVALVGSSGHSTGPHLHYEVLVDGQPRNPLRFFELAERLGSLGF